MRPTLLSIVSGLLLMGCTSAAGPGDQTAAAMLPTGPSAVQDGSPPNVEGLWTWSNVEVLMFPPDVAQLVGVEPEGRHTHARCKSAGTMTLHQTGAAFSGDAIRTSNACRTNGGQTFQQPGTAFQVSDGRINGSSAQFSFHSPPVLPCPHQAVITGVENGIVHRLTGTGHCVVPGHPQSDSPIELDPPPGGTSKTIAWDAVRVQS
jgi:hypothetical protein